MARPNKIWYRKGKDAWVVVIGGKWHTLARGKKNRKLAEEKFYELMLVRPEAPEDPEARVASLCEGFLAWSKKHHAADTYRNHAFYIQSFAEACGNLPVADLKVFHVTRWVDAKKWNETSSYNARRFAFRVFTWALDEGIIGKNPLKGLKKGKGKPRMRALTPDEYRVLLRASEGRFKVFLYTLRQTGARPKEIRTVRWDQMQGDRLVMAEHKTARHSGKPRVIYLNTRMQRLLKRLPRSSANIFLNKRGKPWTTNAVRLQFARLRTKLGLPADVTAYLVRHGWGTQAVLNGTNPAIVAELMGNSLEMVSKVYVHLAGEHEHLQTAMASASRIPKPSRVSPR